MNLTIKFDSLNCSVKTLTGLLVLNTTKLNGDIFINFMLSTLVGELPGVFVLMITMKFFGRRLNLFSMQATLGICCVIMAFLAKTVSYLCYKIYCPRFIFESGNMYIFLLFHIEETTFILRCSRVI